MVTATFGPSALATPANAITAVRVVASPALVLLILREGSPWPALALWAVLVVSDTVDGMVARRQGTTRSGAFLDPLADKLFVLGAMAALVVKGRLWWVPVAVIAAREAAVSLYRSYVGRRGISVPARPWAKAKTVVQDVVVGLALVPYTGTDHPGIAAFALWVAVGLTLVSGAQYLLDGRQVLRTA